MQQLRCQLEKLARSSGLTTIVNKSAELVETLKRGLELQEKSRTGDDQAKSDLIPWRRDVKGKLPAGWPSQASPSCANFAHHRRFHRPVERDPQLREVPC